MNPRAATSTITGEPSPAARLIDALAGLRNTLAQTGYPLVTPRAAAVGTVRDGLIGQLDDYLMPRLTRLDAPLLVVVGGSTGAGKSTLVNSLVRAPVSLTGPLRPTTRAPILVAHPNDARWFTERHVLPGLPRASGLHAEPGSVQMITAPGLAPGLILLDAPDIDSVVYENRALAEQLLAAADLWLFLTTAARYADAVPWSLLRTARDRGTALALVLDRVPVGAEEEIGGHLAEMLAAEGLNNALLFVLPEVPLEGSGLLAERLLDPLRGWLTAVAADADARLSVVHQTVTGAVTALRPAVRELAVAVEEQAAVAQVLSVEVVGAYRAAAQSVADAVRDGALLHGEVLARWHEFVGARNFMRALQLRVDRVRDRISAALTGRTAADQGLSDALSASLLTLIHNAVTRARDDTRAAWQAHPAGKPLLADVDPEPDLTDEAAALVREWQAAVLALVRAEGASRRRTARIATYTLNAAGLLVMIAVFASAPFLPIGAEIAIAGGAAAAGQAVLGAVLGDQAVRELARRGREDLLTRVRGLLDRDAERFLRHLAELTPPLDAAARLHAATAEISLASMDIDTAIEAASTSAAGTPAAATQHGAAGTRHAAAQDAATRRHVAAQRSAADARDAATDARSGTTDARDAATDARSKTSEARDAATDARSGTTEARDGVAEARNAATDARSGTTEAQDEASGARNGATKAWDGVTEARDGVTAARDYAAAAERAAGARWGGVVEPAVPEEVAGVEAGFEAARLAEAGPGETHTSTPPLHWPPIGAPHQVEPRSEAPRGEPGREPDSDLVHEPGVDTPPVDAAATTAADHVEPDGSGAPVALGEPVADEMPQPVTADEMPQPAAADEMPQPAADPNAASAPDAVSEADDTARPDDAGEPNNSTEPGAVDEPEDATGPTDATEPEAANEPEDTAARQDAGQPKDTARPEAISESDERATPQDAGRLEVAGGLVGAEAMAEEAIADEADADNAIADKAVADKAIADEAVTREADADNAVADQAVADQAEGGEDVAGDAVLSGGDEAAAGMREVRAEDAGGVAASGAGTDDANAGHGGTGRARTGPGTTGHMEPPEHPQARADLQETV